MAPARVRESSRKAMGPANRPALPGAACGAAASAVAADPGEPAGSSPTLNLSPSSTRPVAFSASPGSMSGRYSVAPFTTTRPMAAVVEEAVGRNSYGLPTRTTRPT
jgi:hypothetical protein